jgi:3-methylfumaryl-CoA hydratase
MWAGGRFTFNRRLIVGGPVSKTSTIAGVSHEEGRPGRLVLVLVRHVIAGATGFVLTEEHDIIDRKRQSLASKVPRRALADPLWRRDITPEKVMLFRYSELTFNGQPIHRDRRYVTTEEG